MICAASMLSLFVAAGAGAHPPLDAERSMRRIRVPPGYAVELAASEPEVVDPVAIAFDPQGRLFVVEYRDYPLGPEGGKPALSRIARLEDQDGDGRFETRTTFAEIPFAQGIMAYRDGVLVTAAPDVWYLGDADGDGAAERKERIFTGFKPGNPQLRAAHPRWGLDNWVYLTNGLSGGEVTNAGAGAAVSLGQSDFRFSPRTGAFEATTGFGQFGNTFDAWGRRFFCSNRNPTMHAILPRAAMERNPFAAPTKGYEDVAPAGGDAKVYPLAIQQTTAAEHAGTYTAACGVHVHLGNRLGDDADGDVFVCEPTAHLVTRSRLKPHGTSFRAERIRTSLDFLTSDDPWFRPVSLADGPDGALYVVDMYRAVIEHPQYMPPGLADKLDLRAGDDRGRIYRVVARAASPYLAPATADACVAMLTEKIGWRRWTAQRLLVEERRVDLAPRLKELAVSARDPLAQVHALYVLDGIERLDERTLLHALKDPMARVREHAVALAAHRLAQSPPLRTAVYAAADDDDLRVRFQAALAIGALPGEEAVFPLVRIALRDANEPWVVRGVLSGARDRAAALLAHLAASASDRASTSFLDLCAQLGSSAGALGAEGELERIASLLLRGGPLDTWQVAVACGLGEGLSRRPRGASPASLATWLAAGPSDSKSQIRERLDFAAMQALSESRTAAGQIWRIKLWGWLDLPIDDRFAALFEPTKPWDLQVAAVAAVMERNDPAAAPLLIARLAGLPPEARSASIDFLLRRTETTIALLEAIESGSVERALLPLERRVLLEKHADAKVRTVAGRLYGPTTGDRAKVLKRYRSALAVAGDPAKGREVFRRACANCHRAAGEGASVGPDLSDVRQKPLEALLVDVLDPNRAVEPRYADYIVALEDGRVLSGVLGGDSGGGVVLVRPEGKIETIPRASIASMRATGRSLMPEGIEKDVTPEQLADLFAFLRQRPTD